MPAVSSLAAGSAFRGAMASDAAVDGSRASRTALATSAVGLRGFGPTLPRWRREGGFELLGAEARMPHCRRPVRRRAPRRMSPGEVPFFVWPGDWQETRTRELGL